MKQRRGFLILGLAILCGLAAAYVVHGYLEAGTRTVEVVDVSPVLVAAIDIQAGSGIGERQISVVRWPSGHTPKGSFDDLTRLQGRVLRRPLQAGEPVLESALFPIGTESGLASLIDPDFRAVSVKVDPVVGVAGFVKPGTRVDVIATIRRVDLARPVPYTKVVLQDVPVLAIDQKLEEADNGDPQIVSVVTLSVNPEDAQKLTHAAHEGRLQLALRNPSDQNEVSTRTIGVADLVPTGRPAQAGPSVQIVKGTSITSKGL